MIDSPLQQVCNKCKENKFIYHFSFNKTAGSYQRICKPCRVTYMKEYYRRFPEKLRANDYDVGIRQLHQSLYELFHLVYISASVEDKILAVQTGFLTKGGKLTAKGARALVLSKHFTKEQVQKELGKNGNQ